MHDPSPTAPPPTNSSEDRLDSWKEIAVYLGRDVTTVQRWEKREGMPVHRHVHDRLGSVYAFRAELDAWVRSRNLPEAAQESEQAPIAAASSETAVPTEVRQRRFRTPLALLGASLVVVLLFGGYFLRRTMHHASASSGGRLMIGVLPLNNLSGDPGQDYFVNGLSEEVVTELGQLNPARIGVIRYNPQPGAQQTVIPDLAQKAGVGYLLEGSVRRQDAQARISLQLLRVPDQTIVWTESFDRNAGDVLALQSEIAQRIGHELEVQVLGHRGTQAANPEVVEEYLRGRFELSHHYDPVSDAARIHFERAVALDPSYAPAYAGLADFYRARAGEKDEGMDETLRLAEKYADKALALDAQDAEAHAALALIKLVHDWDWPAAREQALQALQLNPSSPEAHSVYATYLRIAGKMPEAVSQRKQALALDPFRADLIEQLGREYFFARDYENGVALARQTLADNPLDSGAHYDLCIGLGYMKQFDESVVECSKVLALEGHTGWVDSYQQEYREHGYGAASLDVARKRLKELQKLPKVELWDLANAYAAAGMKDETLQTLAKGMPIRDPGLLQLRVDPDFDLIRGDPRYVELVRRIGFPAE